MTVGTATTADELLRMPRDGWRYQLIEGELQKMSPSGAQHGRVAARLLIRLGLFVEQHKLGTVYAAETGFRISRDPDTVLAPDASFVRIERDVSTSGFVDGAPDVAFEVVSPSDRYTEVEEKTMRWLRGGATVVVVIDPRTQTARVHRRPGTETVTGILTIAGLLPGWELPLAEIFE